MPDFSYGREISAMAERLGVPADYFDDAGGTRRELNYVPRWPNVWLGISLAGAAYPFLLSLISGATVFAVGVWSLLVGSGGPGWDDFINGPFVFAMYSMFGVVIGFFWATLVVIVTMPIAYLFARSLNLSFSPIWHGAVYGGFVGFVAVLPFVVIVFSDANLDEFWPVIFLLAMGPGLTTVLGQLGGTWGGRRALIREKAYKPAMSLPAAVRIDEISDMPADDVSGSREHAYHFQFGTRHLLIVAVWLSVLLSVIRLSGIPFEFLLPLVMGWFLYQAATLWAGQRLLARLGRWRQARAA